MGWSQKQRAWMRQTMSVAGVTDEDYRTKLIELTGQESSTSDELKNSDFEAVMCWIELEICRAIADGIVTPKDVFKKISDPWSFNRRKFSNNQGFVSKASASRSNGDEPTRKQLDLIDATRKDLSNYEPQYMQWAYIQSVIHNGCFGPAPDCAEKLSRNQASKLINALKEKLSRYADSDAMRGSPVRNILQSAAVDYTPSDNPCPF